MNDKLPRTAVHYLVEMVDHFVHPSLRDVPDMLNRARILIASMVIMAGCALIALITIFLSKFPLHSNISAATLILPMVLWFNYAFIRFWRHGNYAQTSKAVVIVLLVTLIGAIGISGGPLTSPVIYLLVVPVLTAFFFGGQVLGNRISRITIALLAILLLMQWLGVPFIQTVDAAEKMEVLSLVIALLGVSVISAMAFIYEYTAAVLKRERDTEREKFMELAKTDPLTGLANRRNFDAMLNERMSLYGTQNPPQRFALGYLDLDGFKPINDTHGHAVGDEVLCVISSRMQGVLRDSDFVARHGGDEFMIMLDMIGDREALKMMADRLLSVISRPIKTSAGIVSVTGSLGFALYPMDADEIEALKKSADSAMYEAKRSRDTWRIYRDASGKLAADTAAS
ncbi:putative Diguanylate cyclase [Sterolibacterium denitrificans]|uniref:Diguanylate cyclase n=1 Tax=Sterolibacterium denitrificans TaxID=157592 RepID=A0A7Z7HRU4_9PROT|nr:GGDEF domain-containing protein [Sterolibacterium denitrificans]SMB27492.1 putative Diguanylate cyclase [Sterolibacterium denitrificans]